MTYEQEALSLLLRLTWFQEKAKLQQLPLCFPPFFLPFRALGSALP